MIKALHAIADKADQDKRERVRELRTCRAPANVKAALALEPIEALVAEALEPQALPPPGDPKRQGLVQRV